MTTLALEAPTLTPTLIPAIATRKPMNPVMHVQQPAQVAMQVAPARTREEMSDEEVVQAISLGEEWAVEVLYRRYHRYAYALAYRILEDGTAAEDIVQEVFLSIWRKAASYQQQHGTVHSWLQAIVHNRAIDRVRSAAYREQQWKSLQGDEREQERGREREQDPACEQPDVWEEAWERERRLLILQALAELPAEQRQVIEESYFEGYTHFEIAQRWNLPLGTVKGRMRLGLQKMRRFLEEHGLAADL
jgi:RNA polymerase sigma-70 factor, ECF subfamily